VKALLIRIEGDGLALAGETYGDSAGPPVLFFHGGGQSRSAWRGSARKVAEAGFYGISFDLRGHGESDWANDGDYLLDAYGRDIAEIITHFDRPVTLVGASRGGQSALVGAAKYIASENGIAENIRLIMLADVAPDMINEGVDGIRQFYAEGETGFASFADAASSLHRHLGQPLMDDPQRLEKSMRKDEAGRLHWHWDPKTGAQEFLNPPSENQSVLAGAAGVSCPLVLVRAEHSHLLTDAGVAHFKELAPQLEILWARGAHHMFTADRNDSFAAQLLDCLARYPERRSL